MKILKIFGYILLFIIILNSATAFIDHYIPLNYSTISECLIAENLTHERCIINQSGVYNINGTYNFYDVGIVINIDNVELNCNDSSLDQLIAEPELNSVWVGGNNATVHNCNFHEGVRHIRMGDTFSDNHIYDIYSESTSDDNYLTGNNLIFDNITFNSSTFNGLRLNNSTIKNINILNCNKRAASGYGGCLHFEDSNNNNISNFEISLIPQSLGGLSGALFISGDNNIITDGKIDGYDNVGVYYNCIYSDDLGSENLTINNINLSNCYDGIYTRLYKLTITNLNIDHTINKGIYSIISSIIENVSISNVGTVGIKFDDSYMPQNQYCNNINIFNASQEGLNIESSNGVYNNIILNGTGLSSFKIPYYKSLSPKRYNGINYNDTFPEIFTFDFGNNIFIDNDNKDVGDIATGLNNFSLWLLDNETKYIEETPIVDCPTAAALYGGVCRFNYSNYLIANGAGNNYTMANVTGITIVSGYTDPPYLNYINITYIQNYSCIKLTGNADYNNFSNMQVLSSFYGEQYQSVIMSGNNNNFWKNMFLDGEVYDNGSNNQFCMNNEGNFYQEDLTPHITDCGQSTFISPSGRTGVETPISLYVSWNPQDVYYDTPVNYDVFFEGNHLVTTSTNAFIYYNNSLLIETDYNFEIVPYINGSRINGTNTNSNFRLYWTEKDGACRDIKDYVGTSFVFFTIVGLINFFAIIIIVLSAKSGTLSGKDILSAFIIAVVFNIILIAGYYTFIKVATISC